jgi:signal transduction histidine kinase
MSLRVRLFLLLGGLVVLLVAAEWWLVRSLTRDLSGELDQVAFFVGHSVASSIFVDEESDEARNSPLALSADVELVRPEEIDDPEGAARPSVCVLRRGAVQGEEQDHVHEEHGAVREYHIVRKDDDGVVQRFRFSLRPADEDFRAAGSIHLQGPYREETISVPRAGLNRKLDVFSRDLILGTMAVLGLGLVMVGIVSYRVSTPLKELETAAKTVGDGALGTQVSVRASGEVGEAIHSFNRMSRHLKELDDDARALRERQHLTELGEVARGMAHTLRNPLNALGLCVEELAARVEPEDTAEGLTESVRRQIRRMDQSLRSFLVLGSEGGAAEERFEVRSLVQDVALEALQDARGKASLEIEKTKNEPSLMGVQPELRSMLHALTVNAVEASPNGGKVTIRIQPIEGGRIRIEIDDEGAGLTHDVKEHLFTPHVTTKANGTGMGLFLAYRIATTRYDGSLELVDLEPRGTRAVLELSDRKTRQNGR